MTRIIRQWTQFKASTIVCRRLRTMIQWNLHFSVKKVAFPRCLTEWTETLTWVGHSQMSRLCAREDSSELTTISHPLTWLSKKKILMIIPTQWVRIALSPLPDHSLSLNLVISSLERQWAWISSMRWPRHPDSRSNNFGQMPRLSLSVAKISKVNPCTRKTQGDRRRLSSSTK